MLCVILSVIMLCVMLSVVSTIVVILSIVYLSGIMLSVVCRVSLC